MLKKTVPIIMALALCAALTACSSGGSSSGSSSPKSDGSSPSPAPSDAKLVRIESREKKVDCTVSGDKITLKSDERSREYWYYPGTVKSRLRSGFDEYDAALTGALSPSDYAALGIGNILSEKTDEFTKTYEYFDAEGKCVMSETGSGETYTYEYDANGVYTKEYTAYEGGDTSTPDVYDCEYDGSGKLSKVSKLNSDGSVLKWVEYKYDGDGNIASVSCFYEGSTDPEGTAEYEYSDGRLAKKTFYKINDGEKTLNRWYDYSYDDAGHLTEIADNAGSRDDQGSASEEDYVSRRKFFYE